MTFGKALLKIEYQEIYFCRSGELLIKKDGKYELIEKYRVQEIEKENTFMGEIKDERGENNEDYDDTDVTNEEVKKLFGVVPQKKPVINLFKQRQDAEKQKQKQEWDEGGPEYQKIIIEEKITECYILNKGDPKPQGRQFMDPWYIKQQILCIDYETVCDYSEYNPIIPVSLGVQEDKYDIINREPVLTKPRLFHGKDCTSQFLDMIRESKDINYTMVTYNGARFDHYLLYTQLLKLIPDELSHEFFVKNDLLNFKILGLHSMFDLYKHMNMSLKAACEGYNIEHRKQELNFYDVQKKYETMTNEEFDNYLKTDHEYNEYLKHDVICLYELFKKYQEEVINLGKDFKEYGKKLTKFMTLGGLVKTVYEDSVKNQNIKVNPFKKEHLKYFKDLKKSSTGGRSQLFNGKQFIESSMFDGKDYIDNHIFSIDCSGLYPYVMAVMDDAYYPCGDLIECDKLANMPKDLIGFFYCSDIDQSKLKVKIIPDRNGGGGNKDKLKAKKIHNTKKALNWDIDTKITDKILLSTVKIQMLKDRKCKMKIENGFYFSEKVKGCDLFKFILPLMKFKTEQDILKEEGKEYNPARRQIIKSMMLIMSGKLAESLYTKKTEIMTEAEYDKKRKDNPEIDIEILNVVGNKAITKHTQSEEKALKNSQPIYLSTLIYDYSHKYMIENVYEKVEYQNLIMTDTDSNKLRKSDFDHWYEQIKDKPVPHWEEVEQYDERYKTATLYAKTNKVKVIGSFADEYANKKYDYYYFLQKKGYMCGGINDNDMTFKGFNKDDVYLKDDTLIEVKNIYQDIDNERKKKMVKKNKKLIDDEQLNVINDKIKECEIKLNDLYHTSKKIKDDYQGFFRDYYENGHVTVLRQQLTKNKSKLSLNVKTEIKTY